LGFHKITLKDFIIFLANNKSKTIEMVDTKNIQYINNDSVGNIEIISEMIKKDDLDPFWL
jgi:glutaredoxin-related protein